MDGTLPDGTKRRRGVAFLAAVGLALSTVVAGLAPGGPAGAASDFYASGGSLTWDVRGSFITYIEGPIAHGSVATLNGATRSGPTFTFPINGGKIPVEGSTEASFVGAIHLTGHKGTGVAPDLYALDLTIADLRVEFDGDDGELVADVVSRGDDGELAFYDDVIFADLDFTGIEPEADGTTLTWEGVDAVLTEDGSEAFAGYWSAGQALDPISFSLELTDTEPARIEVSRTVGLFGGETVTVTGSGFHDTANGTRPPLNGQPAGAYAVFGRFADEWQPSGGAAAGTRKVISQRWAIPPAAWATLNPAGTNPSYVQIIDGAFTAELTVDHDTTVGGNYGVYTYPGSGATNAAHELARLVDLRSQRPVEAFVTSALTDFIGEVDGDLFAASVEALDSGQSKATFLRELTRSDEWLSALVNELYLDTLDREGDEGGVAYWVAELRRGRSVARVAASFYASAEYYNGIGGGTDQSWVEDLYVKILERDPDEDGVDFWVAEVAAKGRTNVAHRFYQSAESARTRVENLYQALLGRPAEEDGLTYWAARVVREGDLALAVHLAASAEYQSRAEALYP